MSLNIQGKIKNLKNNLSKLFWYIELHSIKCFENNLPYFDFGKRYFTVSKLIEVFKTNRLHKSIPINIHSIGSEISEKLFELKANKLNRNIIFFGSLDYEPNLSAIYWLLEKVMPKVWGLIQI